MSKVNDWSIELKEMGSTRACHVCNGDGKVEVQLMADYFRNDHCETCKGTGQVESEDEYD